jgi:spore germination cell wall hydrolase CwlJ-like protein
MNRIFNKSFSVILLLAGVFYMSSHKPMASDIIDTPVKIIKTVDAKQLACLAKNIYFEAGSESILGQAAVARVVLNRIHHGFGSNPCNVIYQSTTVNKETETGEVHKTKFCQFSWVCENKPDPHKNNPKYKQAQQVAYDVMVLDMHKDVVSKSTLFFHNTSVKPNWSYKESKRIGNHIFYSKYKKQK